MESEMKGLILIRLYTLLQCAKPVFLVLAQMTIHNSFQKSKPNNPAVGEDLLLYMVSFSSGEKLLPVYNL